MVKTSDYIRKNGKIWKNIQDAAETIHRCYNGCEIKTAAKKMQKGLVQAELDNIKHSPHAAAFCGNEINAIEKSLQDLNELDARASRKDLRDKKDICAIAECIVDLEEHGHHIAGTLMDALHEGQLTDIEKAILNDHLFKTMRQILQAINKEGPSMMWCNTVHDAMLESGYIPTGGDWMVTFLDTENRQNQAAFTLKDAPPSECINELEMLFDRFRRRQNPVLPKDCVLYVEWEPACTCKIK